MTRRLASAVVLSALALATPAVARLARFSASLQGAYTAHATMTDTHCWRADENDNVTTFTQTGTASENDTFHSVAPITLTVSQVPRQRIFIAGSFARLRTAFTLNRTSTTDPPYCSPSDQYDGNKPDCGTRHGTYPIRVYGRIDRPAFSYQFNRGSPYYPDDPFTACPLFGPVWPGQLKTSGPAAVAPARLFHRPITTIVIHGHYTGKTNGDAETDLSENGTYDLNWTLTLKRRR